MSSPAPCFPTTRNSRSVRRWRGRRARSPSTTPIAPASACWAAPAARADLLSVVIPALNSAGSLGDCLAAAAAADETIVVDGGSGDGTAALAERGGARLRRSATGRGVQLAAGAAAAAGDWLLFLHADTRLGPGWRAAADRHI